MRRILNYLFPKKEYWVFRRYNEDNSIRFELHFIQPFNTKGEAKGPTTMAKILQPKIEFIILKKIKSF